jgi:ABC-2 type transport system permease protein
MNAQVNGAGFDRAGFDRAGFDRAGFDRAGFDRAAFVRAVRMEWIRLRTIRSTWLIVALALFASGGLGLAVALDGRADVTLELAGAVINPGQPAPTPILLGLLGVFAWGHDYRYGTIRPLLVVQPRREVLVIARVLVVSLFLAAVATAAVLLAEVAGVLATGGALADFIGRSPVPRMLLGSVLFGMGCGWLGMAVGVLLRSLPAAVAVLFAIPVIEPLVGMVLGKIHTDAEVWLPFYAVGQVLRLTPVPAGPSAAIGAAVFLGTALALLTAGVAVFLRRDA